MFAKFGRRHYGLLAILLVAFGGCKPGPKGVVTEAEGTVTIDGKPAVNVVVQFMPDPSQTGTPGSSGMTDDSGHFVMTTADNRKGAIVGTHPVVFQNERADERSKKPVLGPLVPAKYKQPGGETVEISVGKKTYDFALKSQ